MTSFSYTITIGDGEYRTLKVALIQMISHCEKQISEGEDVPFHAHIDNCKEMLRMLPHAHREWRSRNNFNEIDGW